MEHIAGTLGLTLLLAMLATLHALGVRGMFRLAIGAAVLVLFANIYVYWFVRMLP